MAELHWATAEVKLNGRWVTLCDANTLEIAKGLAQRKTDNTGLETRVLNDQNKEIARYTK